MFKKDYESIKEDCLVTISAVLTESGICNNSGKDNISYRIKHSVDVANLCKNITEKLYDGERKEDIVKLMYLAGLFHDIYKFEEDEKLENHGELSSVIFEEFRENIIDLNDKFACECYDKIVKAISIHSDENREEVINSGLLSMILFEADKISSLRKEFIEFRFKENLKKLDFITNKIMKEIETNLKDGKMKSIDLHLFEETSGRMYGYMLYKDYKELRNKYLK